MRPTRARKGWAIERWMTILAAAGIVLTAAVQILRLVEAPVLLFIALYTLSALIAVSAVVIGLRKKSGEENRAWIQEVTSYLAVGPRASGRIPTVSDISPYELGVSRSAYAPDDAHRKDPYVQRQDVDDRLREALSSPESRIVILLGASKSGKSRTMYEAVLDTLPESPLIVPVNEGAIDKLFSLDPPLDLHPAPAVFWLDDLDEARLGALTPALLERLGSEVVVVASMTSQRRNRIAGNDSDIGRTARLALAQAKEIHLDFELTDEERREAEALYPRERFDHSIGEPLVAADQLKARFDAGPAENPVGYTLVRVAIDWRRAGLGRPILDSELRALYPKYLPSIHAGLEPSDELYREGLAWACEPLVSHVALLEKVNAGREHGFMAFDYLVALLEGQHNEYPGRDVSPVIWDFVTDFLSEDEATNAGLTAYLRGNLARAERIWRALAGKSSAYSAEATFYLGISLGEQGNPGGARGAFQQAIDSGHPDVAPMAADNLGNLLARQGDFVGARDAFQWAIDSEHPDAAPMATFNLGALLVEQGDSDGAKATLQQAIDSGHPDVAPDAALLLGSYLAKQGDFVGARDAFQWAIDSEHPDIAPMASLYLGILLVERWAINKARDAFQQAIDSGHPEAAPEAADWLRRIT